MIVALLLGCAPSEGIVAPGVPARGEPPALPPLSPRSPRPHVGVEVIVAGSEPLVTTTVVPPPPSGVDLAAELFSDDVIPAFDVLLSDESVRALRRDPYTYVEGGLVYRGVRYAPVGVRVKGQNSFLPIDEKPSLKVKLDAYVPGLDLLGLEELTLNNMSDDASMMHERVAYRMYREQGVTASRAGHAVVSINGEERGLYAHIETVDEELLALWYDDPTGSMWELWDTDFTDWGVPLFEHEEGVDDRRSLQGTTDALELDDRVRWPAVALWVDASQFLDYAAVSAIVGQFDSYPWSSPGDDCHVYRPQVSELLQFFPHGLDETFSDAGRDFTDGSGLVLDACVEDPACTRDYEARLWAVQLRSEEIDLLGYARRVKDQIAPLAEADQFRPYSFDSVRREQSEMLDFIRGRPARLEDLVGPRP